MPRYSNGLILTPHLTQRSVTVDLKFDPSVGILARNVDKLGMDIRSFKEPLQRAVKKVMIPSIRRNFDSGGRPQWTPLADSTVRIKKGNDDPLIRSGTLRRTMGQMNVWTIDSEKAMIVDLPEKVWYGKVHQAGLEGTRGESARTVTKNLNIGLGRRGVGTRVDFSKVGQRVANDNEGRPGIPARPFVVLQDEDARNIERVFDDWLQERLARAGL